MLYSLNASLAHALRPFNVLARQARHMFYQPWNPLNYSWTMRTVRASLELYERLTDHYERPEWGLDTTMIEGREVAIAYDRVWRKPYCDLLHFKRCTDLPNQPKVLIVAPMSGHYATLLRGTVAEFLPDHEVYITDWINARDVPVEDGTFGFDDYVEYLMDMMAHLGPDTHIVSVCQPCVATLVAIALMSKRGDKNLPRTMALMGGPIDVRISPTAVTQYAEGKELDWFRHNVICRVPSGFKGKGQDVYPGFIQLSGFMSMNMDSHIGKHFKFFSDLVKGDGESAEAHREFYDEYLAVMDMPADFYLETLEKVFLDYHLPKGKMTYRGEPISLEDIKDVALLTVEGEKDDITGNGQTKCALGLCNNIPESRKSHVEIPNVGHYGIFNGRVYREMVAPTLKRFMQDYNEG